MLKDCPSFSNIKFTHANKIKSFLNDRLGHVINIHDMFMDYYNDYSVHIDNHYYYMTYKYDELQRFTNDRTVIIKAMRSDTPIYIIISDTVLLPNGETKNEPYLYDCGNNLIRVIVKPLSIPEIVHFGANSGLEELIAYFNSGFYKKLLYFNVINNVSDTKIVDYLHDHNFLKFYET